jgi:hypothetical protein
MFLLAVNPPSSSILSCDSFRRRRAAGALLPFMSGTRRRLPGYSTTLRGGWKHTPTAWRWPSLGALLLGAGLQIALGIPATGLCFMLLVAADQHRCPVAVGADSVRPFVAWVVGVGIGLAVCESMTDPALSRNPGRSGVLWGSLAGIYRHYTKYDEA